LSPIRISKIKIKKKEREKKENKRKKGIGGLTLRHSGNSYEDDEP
jgi:hypothetical protein